jgi:putative membrane protein
MPEPEGWERLHPLSPALAAGRLVVLGLFLGSRTWAEQTVETSAPALEVVALAAATLVVVGLVTLGYSMVAWRFNVYRLTAEGVELKTGILFRSSRQLRFDRIEAIDTAQPLIPRILGLAEVRIEAISKQGNELKLRYLALDAAEAVRLDLLRRRSAETPALAPAADAAGPLLLAVPSRELLVAYLVLPLVGGVTVLGFAAIVVGWVAGWAGVFGTGLFGLVALLTVAAPAILRLERLWDFRLADGGDALVATRGLLNLNTQRIATGRIQALRIEQPLLWRLVDRYRLVVDVAGYRGAGSQDAAVAATLLPIASPEVVTYVMQRLEARVDVDSLPFDPVPARARWRSLRWASLLLARTDSHIVVRSGVLWRRTTVMARQRLQSARVTQGPWQRWLRLGSVHLDTAGSRITVVAAHRDVGEAVAFAQDVARPRPALLGADRASQGTGSVNGA